MTITRFKTGGMACPACPKVLDRKLESMEGVISAESNLLTGWTTVVYDSALVRVEDLERTIRLSGFDPHQDVHPRRN